MTMSFASSDSMRSLFMHISSTWITVVVTSRRLPLGAVQRGFRVLDFLQQTALDARRDRGQKRGRRLAQMGRVDAGIEFRPLLTMMGVEEDAVQREIGRASC